MGSEVQVTPSFLAYGYDGPGDSRGAFYAALGKVHAAIGGAMPTTREVEVRHDKGRYSYGYIELGPMLARAVPVLAEHGMALIQTFTVDERGRQLLVSELGHESGGVLRSIVPVHSSGKSIQDLGKALTYLRRYVAAGLLAIAAEEDTDGRGGDGAPIRQDSVSGSTKRGAPQNGRQAVRGARANVEQRENDRGRMSGPAPHAPSTEDMAVFNEECDWVLDALGKEEGAKRLQMNGVRPSSQIVHENVKGEIQKVRSLRQRIQEERGDA